MAGKQSFQYTDPATGLLQTVPLVLLSASFAQDVFLPSNVWLYDVTLPDNPVRLAAVSATSSATQAGVVLRMAVKGQYLYTSASQQGLQVIDLQQVVGEYKTTSADDFGQAISTDGGGFAMDAIINDIQLPIPGGGTATMFGLQADDFVVSGGGSGSSAATQTLLVATGQWPLVESFRIAWAAELVPQHGSRSVGEKTRGRVKSPTEGQAPRSSMGAIDSNSRIYSKIVEKPGSATKEPEVQGRSTRGN